MTIIKGKIGNVILTLPTFYLDRILLIYASIIYCFITQFKIILTLNKRSQVFFSMAALPALTQWSEIVFAHNEVCTANASPLLDKPISAHLLVNSLGKQFCNQVQNSLQAKLFDFFSFSMFSSWREETFWHPRCAEKLVSPLS